MARYGDNAIDEVRQRADLVEIIGAHVRLRRTGRNFVGLCPFHNEQTPSFSVNAERGFYHCFGCGAGGTVFNFMMKVEGLSFPEAIRSLATRYGVSLPEQKIDGPAAAERDALARANQTAAEFYAHVLWNTHDGELARERKHAADLARMVGIVARRRPHHFRAAAQAISALPSPMEISASAEETTAIARSADTPNGSAVVALPVRSGSTSMS